MVNKETKVLTKKLWINEKSEKEDAKVILYEVYNSLESQPDLRV